MVSKKDIQATCDDIVREFDPLQVILFGSHAYGTPTEDSDVDLLVVMDIPESETTRQAGEIGQRIPHRFSLDLLVRSPQEIAYRVSHNDWFLREITEKGEVLYGQLDSLDTTFIKEEGQMNPLTLEWVEKAEEDYITVELLLPSPISSKSVICFHAQQCIEKYLKAWLQEANIPAPRTHKLEDLLNLIVPSIPEWQAWNQDFSTLSNHAVDIRYPGKSATAENLEHAVKTCEIVRNAVRKSLKLTQVDTGE
ncbi:HEPN domain-containing protein [Candidatus Poribacteria bacterium]|nr:HEPN domain-containing protein [Candidatus Poribacteria bacterium]MYB64677.1 HEPN domain-containing protein [Candidatus Poribacteria bacterium]MYF57136.1 HEPN domain-containing protein [Candidatus Poribacteria bacterium]MYI93670.1 HEPN domain-containing protein [Candidatus Poribacteria bacterium]